MLLVVVLNVHVESKFVVRIIKGINSTVQNRPWIRNTVAPFVWNRPIGMGCGVVDRQRKYLI